MKNKGIFARPPEMPGLEIRYGEGCELAYRLHTHDSYSLGLVLEGQTGYQCEKRVYRLGAGDALCLAPDTPHACNPEAGQWRYLMCQIAPALWPQDVAADGLPLRNAALNAALLTLWHGAQCCDDIRPHWARLRTALQRLRHAQNPPRAAWRQTLAALGDDGDSIEAWAAAAHISRRQLARLLAPSGMSPHQWLLARRINRGKQLLHQGWSLADTAQALGFADQAHFQRLFKGHTAITPGQYRATADE